MDFKQVTWLKLRYPEGNIKVRISVGWRRFVPVRLLVSGLNLK